MLLIIPKVLNEEELASIDEGLSAGSFVDGKTTAGRRAGRVKENLQLEGTSVESGKLGNIVIQALQRNPTFRAAALPKRILPPLFSRYEKGMEYGSHVDNPIMPSPAGPTRTDLAMTLFLSDADTYDGGELVIHTETGPRAVKLKRGDAVIYPSGSLHGVNPVTKGTRLGAVTWVQSMVRDPGRRELLYDLAVLRQWIEREHGETAEANLLAKIYNNLLRMWSEP